MFVNIAFAVVAIAGALLLMTNTANPDKPRLDLRGTALVTTGLFGVVFGAAKAQTNGWGATITVVFLAAGVVLLLAFLATERRVAYPVVPLHVIGDRIRGAGLLALFLLTIALFAIFLFLTYYFQGVLHYSPVKTGLAFLPLPVTMTGAAMLVQTKLRARLPVPAFFAAGPLTAAAGCVLLAQLAVNSPYFGWVFGGLVLVGLGTGTAFVVAIDVATAGVAPEDAGVAGSLTNVSQQIGPAMGIALLSTVAATATSHYIHSHATMHNVIAHATVHGFAVSFWYGAVIFLAAGVIASVMVSHSPRMAPGTGGATAVPAYEEG
jgi:hypothetical protein